MKYSLSGSPGAGSRRGITVSARGVRLIMRVATIGAALVAVAASFSCVSIFVGSHSSSSSSSAVQRPRAFSAPWLRAFGALPCDGSTITRSRGSPTASSAATVSGSGPSTTTTTSRFSWVWASALSTARVASSGRFHVGMTTLTSGDEDISTCLRVGSRR